METGKTQPDVAWRGRRAIVPRPSVMPHEIVKHRRFDRETGRQQIVPAEDPHHDSDEGQLNRHPDEADEVEDSPAFEESG
jgi:hypothetical protein